MTKVAIQGEEGSYSHEAAAAWFGPDVEILGCWSFSGVFDALALGRTDRAVVPVENTIVGPIAGTTALLDGSAARRVGEIALRVDHCLIVAGEDGGSRLEVDEGRIRRVASHPIALAQCGRFLRARPGWQTIETADTAGAVRNLADGRLRVDAVVASRAAAERHGCRVVRAAIQDEAANVTTFLVLEASTPAAPSPRAATGERARTAPDPCWPADRRR